jgi:hypothetical protein
MHASVHMRALIRILTVLTLYMQQACLRMYVTRCTGRIYAEAEFLDEIQTKVF